MSTPGGTNPAGWYDDGTGTATQRYWDGERWTERTQPGPGSGPDGGTTGDPSAGNQGPSSSGQGDFSYGAGGYAPASTGTPQGGSGGTFGQGQYGPSVPSYGQPVPEQGATKVHPVGWTALALAVVGFIFACIPGALVVGWVLLPVAFVLAIVTFFLKGKKWPAITALIVSVVGTVVGFIVFFVVVSDAAEDAFGDSDVTVSTAPEDAESDAPSSEDEAAPPDDDGGDGEPGSRENPVALGSVISGEEYDVTINTFEPDATDDVMAANQFNEDPPEGFVYALVNASITYTGTDSGSGFLVTVDYVTSTGEVLTSSDTLVVAPEPELGYQELYEGGTDTGNIAIAIPEGDDGLLRVQPGFVSDEVFVATS
ncbi:DUF2510 domain-containing protein [Cellulosimicrobium terreum]|nr:DUF2510 domain-containing protein [Cellulosimicrobium terreum]